MASRVNVGLVLAIVTGMSLVACSEKRSDDDILAPSATSDSGRVEDQFGEGFGEAHRANPNSEPVDVNEVELKPVSTTGEPVQID